MEKDDIKELYINKTFSLVKLKNNWWTILGSSLICHKMAFQYSTFTLSENNKDIYAFDPPGGPFMAVGSSIRYSDDIQFIIKKIAVCGKFFILFKLE